MKRLNSRFELTGRTLAMAEAYGNRYRRAVISWRAREEPMVPADDSALRHAVILAAGMGERRRPVFDDVARGLLVLDGEPIIARSIRLLRAAGIRHITIVAGYRAEQYVDFAAREQG